MADGRGGGNRLIHKIARKHAAALIAIAVYNIILFAPVLFAGRVISPNDLIARYDPWLSMRSEPVMVKNNLMLDPPASYYSLMALARHEPEAFHWNPYVGAGTPGWGSSTAAVLSPFILLPAFLVPLPWVYTAIIFLKLNVAFVFAYLWLREERLGKYGAAIGAIIVAGSGIVAVRWLWQVTNATVLYPALLWLVRRAFNGRRTSIALMTLIALAYALAGFPSTMAYGAYIAVAYALFLFALSRVRERAGRRPGEGMFRRLAEGLFAAALAALIAAPSIVALAQWLPRSGFLDVRRYTSTLSFPASHALAFFVPEYLGNPARNTWSGNLVLGTANNFVEATIYAGVVAIPLTLLALAWRRRRSTRWFWVAALVVILACMFGVRGISTFAGQLPGIKYSMLTRLAALLPLPAGFLSAAGMSWLMAKVPRKRRALAIAIALIAAADLAYFAAKFQPYLLRRDAAIPSTPVIDFLRADKPPFRVVPFFNYLWPNTAQMFGIQDLRSQFMSEAAYRRLLLRIDPGSWTGKGTIIGFNSLDFRFDDPVAGMLGVRWFLEHRAIDIIKWKTFEATERVTTGAEPVAFQSGAVLRTQVRVAAMPFWAIDVPVEIESTTGIAPRLVVALEKNGAVIWSRAFRPEDIQALNHIYVPLLPRARLGDTVAITIRSRGIRGKLENGYGRVKTPVIFDRELPDGRLFRNLAEVPRFHPVSRLRKLTATQFLEARDIDLGSEAVITEDVALPNVNARDARIALTSYRPAEQRVMTESSADFFLASSEKVTPELRVYVDGRVAKVIEINTLFAGLVVPRGRHEVVFARRIGRGWWWPAGIGVVAWLAIAAAELTSSRRRR